MRVLGGQIPIKSQIYTIILPDSQAVGLEESGETPSQAPPTEAAVDQVGGCSEVSKEGHPEVTSEEDMNEHDIKRNCLSYYLISGK